MSAEIPPKVTIGICTWNRADSLKRCLASICDTHSNGAVLAEVLVVDNNSTDNTAETCVHFSEKLPLTYLLEKNPGKSNALNAGAAAALGEYIIWIDDDVTVTQGWLEAYFSSFSRHPETTFWGGPITPRFPEPVPSWASPENKDLWPVFVHVDHGTDEISLSISNLPCGANWAIRTQVQREYSYDSRLGPQPGNEVRGEETTLYRNLLADNHKGRWVPGALVYHHIPESRMSLRYVREWYYGYGVSVRKYGRYKLRPATRRSVYLAAPRLLLYHAMYLLTKLRPGTESNIRWMARSAFASGFLMELLREH